MGRPVSYTEAPPTEPYLEFAGTLLSLSAAITVPSSARSTILVKLVAAARRMLSNLEQCALMAMFAQGSMAFVVLGCAACGLPAVFEPVHVLWVAWVQAPLLALPLLVAPPEAALMTEKRTPGKNSYVLAVNQARGQMQAVIALDQATASGGNGGSDDVPPPLTPMLQSGPARRTSFASSGPGLGPAPATTNGCGSCLRAAVGVGAAEVLAASELVVEAAAQRWPGTLPPPPSSATATNGLKVPLRELAAGAVGGIAPTAWVLPTLGYVQCGSFSNWWLTVGASQILRGPHAAYRRGCGRVLRRCPA